MLALLDLVHTVPVALPHLYVMVCVKALACFVTFNVIAVPSVPLDTVRLLFRGIVVRVLDVEAFTVPELIYVL